MSTAPVALVTGGAKRIGAQIVKTLHHKGYRVLVHYNVSHQAAEHLADELNTLRPGSAACVQANLCQPAAIPSLGRNAIAAFGQIDVLINNASAFYPTPIGAISTTDWDTLMGSNVQGALFLIQALQSQLSEQCGSVINLIDIHVDRPLPLHSVYVAAKSALASLTRSLAVELAPNIRVNGIAPGAILWPERGLSDEQKNNLLASIPLQQLGTPEDIGHAISFLLEAQYITGQIIYVDGGRSVASGASA